MKDFLHMQLMLATQNIGKQREIQAFLEDLEIEIVLPPGDFDVEETGATLEENARLKAEGFARAYGIACLADDSGLVVRSLDGRPGVLSKRYGDTDEQRMAKLLEELDGHTDRSAYFACCMCLCVEGETVCAEGRVEGSIASAPVGSEGFGYDPIFIPDGYMQTFGQLGQDVKNTLSHRARAVQKIREILSSRYVV